jgi:hypothetical protein
MVLWTVTYGGVFKMRIEVIGLEPPCKKCSELLDNAKAAVADSGIEAEVVKLWVLSDEVREKYGLPLSPALAIDGVLVAQGKVYSAERIASLLKG